jgi:hypothetical protein
MRTREGCCAAWPKPCSYHEAWQDALDREGPRPSDREWEERWEGENKRANVAEAKLARYEAAALQVVVWRNEGRIRKQLTAAEAMSLTNLATVTGAFPALDKEEK